MNTRFAVPAAVALALHATLLFGFRRSHYTPPGKTPLVKMDEWPPIVMPPEIEIVPASRVTTSCGGAPVAPPELPETLPPIEKPIFVMDPRPPAPKPIEGKVIDWENFGPGREGPGFGPESIFPPGMLDNSPHTRTQASPAYPHAARTAGLTGTVWVEFVVDTSGYVHDPVAVRSTDRIFEEASVRAVSRWRFEPGKRDGRAVNFRMVVPVVFSLTDE